MLLSAISLQDTLLLVVLELLFLVLELSRQQLQLGGVRLEVHVRALLIRLPREY